MSRDSGSEDEHYEEESMMSHIDYDESTSNDDLMELYTNNGSTCMEDMELYSDIGSTCMEDMELYSDIGSSSMEDMVEYLYDIDSSCMDNIELDEYLAMQEAAHGHHKAMTFTKFPRGTFYDATSPQPSSSRRRNMHKNGHAHASQHHVATQG